MYGYDSRDKLVNILEKEYNHPIVNNHTGEIF